MLDDLVLASKTYRVISVDAREAITAELHAFVFWIFWTSAIVHLGRCDRVKGQRRRDQRSLI